MADTILVENRWVHSQLERRTSTRVVFAPPGIDLSLFRPRRNGEESERKPFLLSVARFDDIRKRLDVLIRAYGLLLERLPDAPDLILAGLTGPRPEVWDQIRSLGLAERVHFERAPSMTELARLYRAADLFVLSSAEEGLGLVLLEAQASGVPVVATRTRGAETAVREGVTGLLTGINDAESLAEGMFRLLTDRTFRIRMGRAARMHMEAEFSESVASERFLAEYRRLLRGDRSL